MAYDNIIDNKVNIKNQAVASVDGKTLSLDLYKTYAAMNSHRTAFEQKLKILRDEILTHLAWIV